MCDNGRIWWIRRLMRRLALYYLNDHWPCLFENTRSIRCGDTCGRTHRAGEHFQLSVRRIEWRHHIHANLLADKQICNLHPMSGNTSSRGGRSGKGNGKYRWAVSSWADVAAVKRRYSPQSLRRQAYPVEWEAWKCPGSPARKSTENSTKRNGWMYRQFKRKPQIYSDLFHSMKSLRIYTLLFLVILENCRQSFLFFINYNKEYEVYNS